MFRVFSVIILFSCGVYTYIECKVCQSMDIRNSVTNLGKLRNCTEIAGYLRIVLMEKAEESDFANYVFPELTHITGYLLLYDVVKLTSIAQLFPNLRVVRGKQLFLDAVIIIHSVPDLKEIGTEKLIFIGNGLVYFDKVPSLCYVKTIDWNRIGALQMIIYGQNKDCEPCPRQCGENCWNSYKCQEVDTDKCHIECLGCKKYNSSQDCLACKNFEDDGKCVPKCPKNKIVHSYYSKCISEDQCRNNFLNLTIPGDWFVFNKVCINDCPQKYRKDVSDKNETTCTFCGDKCTKYCVVKEPLESMNDIEKIQGCTHIEGSIHVKYGTVNDLEPYLSSIKYIRDSLVIARSKYLRSLDFLNNLAEIEGKNVNRYAILVYENRNLQHLWNFSNPNFKLKIRNGTIGFQNNPLLCLSEITQLAKAVNIKYNDIDVSRNSNGDKASCSSIIDLHVKITKLTSSNASLSWRVPKCDKICIGYTVFYIVALSKDVSKLSSKDFCLENQWNSIFTSNNTLILKGLMPYKTYAFYIKSYQSSALGESETNLTYFTTLPDKPPPPRNLVAVGISPNIIQLQWNESIGNGILSHYRVKYYEETQSNIQDLRDYCLYPRTITGGAIDRDSSIFSHIREHIEKPTTVTKVCNCKKMKESFPVVSFLNFDFSYPTCDANANPRFGLDKCESVEYTVLNDTQEHLNITRRNGNIPKKSSSKEIIIKNIPRTHFTVHNFTNLKHFTTYIFYFSACNYLNESENSYICSPDEYTFGRTLPKADADNITNVIVKVNKADVQIDWTEPKDPNSKILTYTVTYTKDAAFAKPTKKCIPRTTKFNGTQLLISGLSPGKYSIKVQSESLAGPGRWSNISRFEITYPPDEIPTVVVTTILILICIVIAILLFLFWYKKKLELDNLHLIASINPDYDTTIYVADDWEMDRNNIEIQTELGHGTFGIVYQGKIKSTNLQCAIKTINETRNLHEGMEFLNEASVMKAFSNCHHVVKLLGVVSRGEPPLVVMELMENGDLKKFLYRMRDDSSSLTTKDIYRMAIEIADGMAYLSAKKFVHRDLAARNCMVAADRTVKVGDFGMARDIYETDYYKKESRGLLPVRWMAPESLGDGVFTSNSDVWSYGIVLWEIATLAEQPYQGLSNDEVLRFVVSKGQLERPTECPDIFFEIMKICWSWRPNDRPTFWDIVERLEGLVDQDFKLVSFVHSSEGIDQREIHDKQRVYSPPALSTDQERVFLLDYAQRDNEIIIPNTIRQDSSS